jgi:hypothetical protein
MQQEQKKRSNAKTALTIALIPLFFFVMVFVKRIWFS